MTHKAKNFSKKKRVRPNYSSGGQQTVAETEEIHPGIATSSNLWKVRYSYLPQQFQNCDDLWAELKQLVAKGEFTLGPSLEIFEEKFADLIGSQYAIGVKSGTDAIKTPLKAFGVALVKR